MLLKTPIRAKHSPSDRWVGLRAVICAFLFVMASFQEASHNHGLHLQPVVAGAQTLHSVTAQVAATDLDCPLCAAMHGASPASAEALTVSRMTEPETVAQYVSGEISLQRAFALFSRPPPALRYS